MNYDPDSSFRYIPSPATDQLDAELREMEITELAEAAHVYDRILAMFDSPGWGEVRKILLGDRDFLDAALRKVDEPSEWKFIRGQVRYCDWLLALDTEIAKHKRTVLDRIKGLEGEAVDV